MVTKIEVALERLQNQRASLHSEDHRLLEWAENENALIEDLSVCVYRCNT